ncbi:hypothetical protein [Wolbachia endosymbiont of Ctenocephalides felis wCfeJ]|uniref:hypothetical protein n=1 Tax=Wolbachia endosymbiont of Ctenocephalides felis wCfeJ TaxID=2732594 RepID=UPI001444F60E|nr:hypothetical protein [Wolbachia endosymbiont of Ctenocephalides felis wCfeJ]WCR57828.1 MAG: hypothetical protein PG980_000300 [Wolbachia endosymbiont of Ctenocephalides felis wCfeJ]
MNSGAPLSGINVTHSVGNINDAIGFFPKAWRATKKYSVNNTLPTVAVSTWIQFSLAYVAAVMITHNNLSYITDIFNSQLMPAYALASVILGTILLTSLVIKYIHTQEIKDEKSKNGDSSIDIKIRGGESDGINEIAQNASVIEIVPDTSLIGNKKENFSIVLPIAEKQGETLENKRQENRNKIILLTAPYVLSSLIIAGALAKFGFVHIRSWKEWTFIAAVVAITVVSALITLIKNLKNNEVNNACNIVKKFNSADILLPWRKGGVISVMENKFESKEENDLQSQALRLFERFLTGFKNDVCRILDKQLTEANKLFKKDLLDPSNEKIQEALNHLKEIREDIKKDLDWLHAEISKVLNDTKELTKKANSLDIKGTFSKLQSAIKTFNDTMETVKNKVKSLKLGKFGIPYFDTTQSDQNEHESGNNQAEGDNENSRDVDGGYNQLLERLCDLEKEIQELKKSLEEAKNKQAQPKELDSGVSSETSSPTSNGSQRDEEEILDEELARLEKEERMEEKREKIKNLKEARPKQKEIKEWKKEINGKPSEFLYYVLESIKLGEKATLRNLDNKIIIHWKDGSRTICYIEKQGDLPSTEVDFIDPDIQAAFGAACVG